MTNMDDSSFDMSALMDACKEISLNHEVEEKVKKTNLFLKYVMDAYDEVIEEGENGKEEISERFLKKLKKSKKREPSSKQNRRHNAEKEKGENYAERMNQRAVELGCTGTHFENASGLNGASHYTTARDMALIANAAISNDTIRTILQTKTYQLPASKNRSALTITNGNKMINSANSQYYEGIVGGKTGYTSKAGNTLAEAADVAGHRLVAVVMKSNGQHYNDIKKLFDYGKALIEASANGGALAQGNEAVQPGPGSSSGNIDPGLAGGPGSTTGSTAGNNGGVTNITGPGAAAGNTGTTTTGFVTTGNGTQYVKSDGSLCKNEWLDLLGKSYFFDGDGYMCKGWVHFSNDAYYYFNPETGEMVANKWVTEDGKSYYLGPDGVMATNTIIDGTYRVNEKGEYVEKVA